MDWIYGYWVFRLGQWPKYPVLGDVLTTSKGDRRQWPKAPKSRRSSEGNMRLPPALHRKVRAVRPQDRGCRSSTNVGDQAESLGTVKKPSSEFEQCLRRNAQNELSPRCQRGGRGGVIADLPLTVIYSVWPFLWTVTVGRGDVSWGSRSRWPVFCKSKCLKFDFQKGHFLNFRGIANNESRLADGLL